MAAHDLDIAARFETLKSKQSAYWQASRADKGPLMDTLEGVTGLDRKTIIRPQRAVARPPPSIGAFRRRIRHGSPPRLARLLDGP